MKRNLILSGEKMAANGVVQAVSTAIQLSDKGVDITTCQAEFGLVHPKRVSLQIASAIDSGGTLSGNCTLRAGSRLASPCRAVFRMIDRLQTISCDSVAFVGQSGRSRLKPKIVIHLASQKEYLEDRFAKFTDMLNAYFGFGNSCHISPTDIE